MSKQLLITILLLKTALATAHTKNSIDHGRIINGFQVDISKVPFHVEVKQRNHFCGGSILSEDYVITAAHCTQVPVDNLIVLSGSTVVDKGVQSKVVECYQHPNYNSETEDYDVAILKVQPLSLSREHNMLPVALPPLGTIWPSLTLVSVTGWGLTERNTSSSTLLQAVLRTQDRFLCERAFSMQLTERMLCSRHLLSLQSICQGDSGSPLVLYNSNLLVGIVSLGEKNCGHPGPTLPSIYTNVAHPEIRQFIKDKTGL